MEEGSLSRTMGFNYGHSYTQEEYAMERQYHPKWLAKKSQKWPMFVCLGCENTHFYECTLKKITRLMTPFQDSIGKLVSET